MAKNHIKTEKNVPILLLGNKCELVLMVTSKMAKNTNVEVSAKCDVNISRSFWRATLVVCLIGTLCTKYALECGSKKE